MTLTYEHGLDIMPNMYIIGNFVRQLSREHTQTHSVLTALPGPPVWSVRRWKGETFTCLGISGLLDELQVEFVAQVLVLHALVNQRLNDDDQVVVIERRCQSRHHHHHHHQRSMSVTTNSSRHDDTATRKLILKFVACMGPVAIVVSSGDARGFGVGSRGMGSGRGSPSQLGRGDAERLCPSPENVFDFLNQNGAVWCILRAVFFYLATHMQRIGIARYMLQSGVCLTVCHRVIMRCYINAAECITQSTEN